MGIFLFAVAGGFGISVHHRLVISVRSIVFESSERQAQIHKEGKIHEITKCGCEGSEYAKYVVTIGHTAEGSS